MIGLIGEGLLLVALVTALGMVFAGSKPKGLRLQQSFAASILLLTAVAFALLLWAFYTSDTSLAVVAANSHPTMTTMYRLAGLWGNHEGSMLLWCLMVAGWGAVLAFAPLGRDLRRRALIAHGLLTSAFYAYTAIPSNPFARRLLPELGSQELNPILQDPALTFHPPLIYIGYTGYIPIYALMMAGLWQAAHHQREGKADPWPETLHSLRPYGVVAWLMLSAGVLAGSWWAYHELGWGGWWFWDPVENVSLIPWLSGTALVHVLAAHARRGDLAGWAVGLSLATCLFCLLGTFLVRSGLLLSVHGFAQDSARGMYLLGLLLIVTLAAGVGILRGFPPPKVLAWRSLSQLSQLHAVTFLAAALTLMISILYPIILVALSLPPISVGRPYYLMTVVPLVLVAFIFAPLPGLNRRHVSALWWAASASLAAIVIMAYIERGGNLLAIFAAGVALWTLLVSLADMVRLHRHGLSIALVRPLAHAAVAVAIIGMVGSTTYAREEIISLQIGETAQAAGLAVHLQDVEVREQASYVALTAQVVIDGRYPVAPSLRWYQQSGVRTTEAGVARTFFADRYVTLGLSADGRRWPLRVRYNPMINFLWLGSLIALASGAFLLVLLFARYRFNLKGYLNE
ncbi:MAG: cytochrome c-type biogenesis CcmF C-terminal domain-containing protein [Pseudomonadota bacterium]